MRGAISMTPDAGFAPALLPRSLSHAVDFPGDGRRRRDGGAHPRRQGDSSANFDKINSKCEANRLSFGRRIPLQDPAQEAVCVDSLSMV